MYYKYAPSKAGPSFQPSRISGIARFSPVFFLLWLFSALPGFGQTQIGTLAVTRPTFMAIDTDASGTRWLYVSNHGDAVSATGGGVVWKFNLTTGSTTGVALTQNGTNPGQFIEPDGIAIDPATHDLFVSDRYLDRVQRLHSDGTFVMAWGNGTAGDPNEMHGPCGLAVDGAGGLYIAMHGDYNGDPNHLGQHVVKYTYSGSGSTATVQRVWSTGQYTATGQPGDFMSTGPYGVVVSGGTVYAADAYFQRVQAFSTTDGHYISLFNLGSGLDPLGMSLDSTGALWVAETSNANPQYLDGQGSVQQVQKYSLSGTYAGVTLPEAGGNLHAFDCVVDTAANRAYVSNYASSTVDVFDLGGSTGGTVPVVSNATVAGTVWTPITNVQVSATNSPTTFSAPDLALYGLSISSTGVISGTPTATASNAKVNVTATNAAGTSAVATITLNIAGATQAPNGPIPTFFNFEADSPSTGDLRMKIVFSEPVSGVTLNSFVFTPEGYDVGHGTFDSVSAIDDSTYELHFTFIPGTETSPAAPGAFRFDVKSSGSGIIGKTSGLPYSGGGVSAAVVPVTPHTDVGQQFAPIVTSFAHDAGAGNTVNFVVKFDHEVFNIKPADVAVNVVSGTPSATVGYIQPAPQDEAATVWNIPVTFNGTGSISLTLSDPGQDLWDGNHNWYVGPNTSDTFTLPATASNPPYVNNAVVQGTVGTAISPVQVVATNSPTHYDAPSLANYGLAIDATAGVITGTPTTAANGATANVTATNAAGTSNTATITLQLSSAGSPPPAVPVVTSATSAAATVGTAFTYQISATNSPTSFGATNLSGTGLSLNTTTGVISGTPGTAGTISTQLTASNAGGTSSPVTLTITVNANTPPPAVPVVTSATSASATVGTTFSYQITATNSPTSYAATNLSGTGLSLNTGTGVISGTPGTAGTITTQLTAANASGTSAAVTLTITVGGSAPVAPTITSATSASATVGASFRYQITATGSPTSYGADNLSGTGLSLDATTGVLSGTPLAAGTIITHVTATNSSGTSAPVTLSITVSTSTPPPAVPVITSATTASATAGAAFSYQITASSSPTSFGADNLSGTGLALNTSTGLITGTPANAGTITTHLTATNSVGTSAPVTLTISVVSAPPPPPPPPPQKQGQTVTFIGATGPLHVGDSIQLTASASSGLPVAYSVLSGDGIVAGGTLTFTGTTPVVVRATQSGSATYLAASADATFVATKVATTVQLTEPSTTHTDTTLALNATTDSGLPITYSIVSGPATINGNTLTFTGSGAVVVRASVAGNSKYESSSTDVTITGNPVPRLINISARANVTANDSGGATIAGFVVTGDAPKQILIRAVGPGLTAFGIKAPLADPSLKLYDDKGALVATNSGWADDPQVTAAGDGVGAFKLAKGSKDAAILATLKPGAYTAQVQSTDASGTVLVEVYDVSANAAVPTKQLVNISTRGSVGLGDNAIVGGFVVSGSEPKSVLIRAIGPGLSSYGVTGVLADPVVTIYDHTGTVIATNDNWGSQKAPATAADITAADTATGAFPLATGSMDSAIVLTLQPGSYTAIVTGAGNTTGNALVEVYEVPTP